MAGGSIGPQIGASATDVVLVFRTRKSVDDFLSHNKVTLGADAAVAAGPIGRQAEADTDLKMRAEILSYSRSRGLFAGVAIEGASLHVRHRRTTRITTSRTCWWATSWRVETPTIARWPSPPRPSTCARRWTRFASRRSRCLAAPHRGLSLGDVDSRFGPNNPGARPYIQIEPHPTVRQPPPRRKMIVEFRCKDCGQSYRAPRDMGGTLFECRRCRWPIFVPGRVSVDDESGARDGDRRQSRTGRLQVA